MEEKKEKDPTIADVLSAINEFATKVEGEFVAVRSDISGLKSEVSGLKTEIGVIKSTMVTKDHLDDKLADLKGDLITVVRKENTKVVALIQKLREKNVLDDADMNFLLAMDPFPDLRALHATA